MTAVEFAGKPYEIPRGRDLLDGLLDAGAPIAYLCMSGSCGTCRCRILAGQEHLSPPDAHDLRFAADGSIRLACQTLVIGDGPIRVTQDGI